jgi:hypothetical protein
MKTLALLASICALTAGQSPVPSIGGTWTAEFEGHAFVRLELSGAGGTMKGGISVGNFELDKAGAVRRANVAPPGLRPISDVKQAQSVMTFSVVGTDDSDRFEFKLIDASRAELRLLLTDEVREELEAEGIPTPQPISLTRR